jgi:hypothetical protein
MIRSGTLVRRHRSLVECRINLRGRSLRGGRGPRFCMDEPLTPCLLGRAFLRRGMCQKLAAAETESERAEHRSNSEQIRTQRERHVGLHHRRTNARIAAEVPATVPRLADLKKFPFDRSCRC